MRWLLLVALFLGCASLVLGSPEAPPPSTAPASAKVSLDLKDTPLRKVLQQLFQGTKQSVSVNPDVPDTLVTVKIKDVDFETAVRVVTRLAGADYGRKGDAYTVQKRFTPSFSAVRPGNPPRRSLSDEDLAGKLITLDLERVPIRKALTKVFEQAHEKYRVEPDVPSTLVSIHVTQVDLLPLLQVVTQQSNATYALEDGIYVIRRAP